MKAQKVVVTIKMEALSIDCLQGLLAQVVDLVKREYETGEIVANDGDTVRWETTRTQVSF